MNSTDIINQLIGLAAMGCFMFSFQFRNNKSLLVMQVIAAILFSTQFVLLGGLTGCINHLLVASRNIIIMSRENHKWAKWIGWPVIIILFSLVSMIMTWSGWISTIPFLACTISTIGYWTYNPRVIRMAVLCGACPCWLIYAIYYQSIGGILNESLSMASILISIYRYGWEAMGDEDFGKSKK